MAKYRVETTNGTYEVETEDPQTQPEDTSIAHTDPEAFERSSDYPNALATDPSVTDYLNVSGIGGLAKAGVKAGAMGLGKLADAVAPQLERIGRNQTMKGLGGSMSQIRQMATKGGLDDAARFANEKGLNDVFSTSLGRENLLKNIEQQTGSKLGDIRQAAGPVPNPEALEPSIMQAPQMQKYLGKGLESGQAGDIPKAVEDIKRISGENPTFASRAKAATELNQSAAGSKLYQPTNATTDVANILSHENNAGIRSAIGPEKSAEYDTALSDYSKIEPLKHLQERGELREISSRGGQSMWGDIKHTIGDAFGHRGLAKASYAGADAAKTLSGIAPDSIGGVTSHLMKIMMGNPAALGRYAAPLMKAAQEGGNQGLAATHYILSTTHPEYNQLINGKEDDVISPEASQ